MKRISLVISMAAVLAACGGGSGSSGDAADAVDGGTEVAAGASVGDTASGVDTSAGNPSVPDLGAALREDVQTATLQVGEEFAFETARTIDIDFDIAEAQGQTASVTICTAYQKDGDAYDVDYDSCSVQGTLDNGVFSHEMEVTNEFNSVVGVVWFQNPSMAPLYREFFVDDASRSKGEGAQNPRIVWK